MTIEEDIFEWATSRPAWQVAVLGRLSRGELISDEDITGIATHLINDSHPPAEPIAVADLSGTDASVEPITLDSLTHVDGVNALIPGQSLSFGESGLTIIYGDNGSGKSGYARLLRQAVTARSSKHPVIGNVFDPDSTSPAASLTFRVGSQPT